MKKLSIGIQTFEKLITENYLYIDKTKSIFRLIQEGSVYFLARPRRFGKSLLLSTLEAIFRGKKELFEDLWIYDSDYQWQEYPVIKISFNGIVFENEKTLENYINNLLSDLAQKYQIELKHTTFYERFKELIERLSETNKVVVLIDEYDKPILDVVDDIEMARSNRKILKAFYTVLKDADPYLRFVFLTGVSKFSKVSVFSGLNHLNDISMNRKYTDMLGYTQEEVEHYFAEYLNELAADEGVDMEILLSRIRKWYNGYQFSVKPVRVYNPFSIMLLLDQKRFKSYWFETGTPSFLIELIKTQGFDLPKIRNIAVSETAFSSYEIERLRVLPLLLQTGYLTIQNYNKKRMLYTLDYPNFEVKSAFMEQLTEAYAEVDAEFISSYLYRLIDAVDDEQFDEFFSILRTFFANIPYDIQLKNEKYYQTIFYLVFTLLGMRIDAEVKTNKGRIDAVLQTSDKTVIFEFKLYDSAETALEQLRTREYYQKYQNSDKQLVLVGVGFELETRNIGEWLMEEVERENRT